MTWRKERTVKTRHIKQGSNGTCYLLAAATNNLQFTRKAHDRSKLRFTFYDEWGDVRYIRQRQVNDFTDTLERAYTKFRYKEYGDNKTDTLWGGKTQQVVTDVLGTTGVNRDWMADTDELLRMAQPGEQLDMYSRGTLTAYAHAYSIIDVQQDSITLFNPWGITSTFDRPQLDDIFAGGDEGYGVVGLIDNPFK